MRRMAVVAGLLFAFALNAKGQSNAAGSFSFASVSLLPASFAAPAPEVPAAVSSRSLGLPGLPATTSLNLAPPDPQEVQGVFVTYSWQAYFGYTFFRFYEAPGFTPNLNGFNYSMIYYFKDWIGADGEFVAAHGSQAGDSSWFLFGGGGPRFRWSAPRGLEVWGHALAGYSHFTPQTAFGNQSAFAFELGAGVDINAHRQKWALRFSGDVIGSRYFQTHQYSPKFSAGVVYKF